MLGDAEALTFWGGPLDREGARHWIERNLARYEADGFGRCAVIMLETGELVGDCGLITTAVEGQPEVELGWIVRRAHWGKGIATEAAAAWRDFAFDTVGLERIVSMINAENTASRRVAEKLGMTVEREALWGDLPHLMYSLTAGDQVGRLREAGPRSGHVDRIPLGDNRRARAARKTRASDAPRGPQWESSPPIFMRQGPWPRSITALL
jgi:RimJ/RimL family protein N-acetyltransferase